MSLDSALASSQQAREALEHQLKERALEAHRVRIGLAQVRIHTEALAATVEALEGRLDDEKAAHEQTRRMLAEALISKSAAQGDISARRRRKP